MPFLRAKTLVRAYPSILATLRDLLRRSFCPSSSSFEATERLHHLPPVDLDLERPCSLEWSSTSSSLENFEDLAEILLLGQQ